MSLVNLNGQFHGFVTDHKQRRIISFIIDNYKSAELFVDKISPEVQLVIAVSKFRKQKSIDANSYMWILAQKIAKVIGSTKELVYQSVVKDVGDFYTLPIEDKEVENFKIIWGSKGLGWFAEESHKSKLEGYTKMMAYYGSSMYDSKQMSVLIDELIYQAKELDIDTLTLAEKSRLIEEWGNE